MSLNLKLNSTFQQWPESSSAAMLRTRTSTRRPPLGPLGTLLLRRCDSSSSLSSRNSSNSRSPSNSSSREGPSMMFTSRVSVIRPTFLSMSPKGGETRRHMAFSHTPTPSRVERYYINNYHFCQY